MSEKVKIRVRNVCGVNRGYPMNEAAKKFAELILPRKTFNSRDVELIQELGFELEIETVRMEEVVVK
jgi:hypothetical protein